MLEVSKHRFVREVDGRRSLDMDLETYYAILRWRGEDPSKIDPEDCCKTEVYSALVIPVHAFTTFRSSDKSLYFHRISIANLQQTSGS